MYFLQPGDKSNVSEKKDIKLRKAHTEISRRKTQQQTLTCVKKNASRFCWFVYDWYDNFNIPSFRRYDVSYLHSKQNQKSVYFMKKQQTWQFNPMQPSPWDFVPNLTANFPLHTITRKFQLISQLILNQNFGAMKVHSQGGRNCVIFLFMDQY